MPSIDSRRNHAENGQCLNGLEMMLKKEETTRRVKKKADVERKNSAFPPHGKPGLCGFFCFLRSCFFLCTGNCWLCYCQRGRYGTCTRAAAGALQPLPKSQELCKKLPQQKASEVERPQGWGGTFFLVAFFSGPKSVCSKTYCVPQLGTFGTLTSRFCCKGRLNGTVEGPQKRPTFELV